MALHGASRNRTQALASILALSVAALIASRNPAAFGWPGAFIISSWTPGPIRALALRELEENALPADLPLLKKMLRSDDPRLRRRGIALMDRFRSMDEFFELERLTRDRDAGVRATAHAYLPIPRDQSLAVAALMPGLRDDSDEVVAAAADRLENLNGRAALPELVAYLRAKRPKGTFVGADVAIGNIAAKMAALKLSFGEAEPILCGTPFVSAWEERSRPWPRFRRAAAAFGQSLMGNWDDGFEMKPEPFPVVEAPLIADDFAARDRLLEWWDARDKKAGSSRSKMPGRGKWF
jgi:hypothetical protein